eukprot:106788_1
MGLSTSKTEINDVPEYTHKLDKQNSNSNEKRTTTTKKQFPESLIKLLPDDYKDSNQPKILLHSCCAPCSGAMFTEMLEMDLNVTIFFYNPNIHPRKEYEIRKEENKRYAIKHNVPFIDCDYDVDNWFKKMQGLEFEPERGIRCTKCFDMRMEVTAAYASENHFPIFTTTNATSRWKDIKQVNESGIRAGKRYDNTNYWIYDWQTDEMTLRKYEISANERFYKQEYCGCTYSLRDSNIWRKQNGIALVRIGGDTAGLGTRYFEDPIKDSQEESQDVVDAFFKDANEGFYDEKLLKKIYESRKKSHNVIQYDDSQMKMSVKGMDKKDNVVLNGKEMNLCEINNW